MLFQAQYISLKEAVAGFQESVRNYPTVYPSVSTMLTSTAAYGNPAWLQSIPFPHKDEGGRVIQGLRDWGFALKNEQFLQTVKIGIETMEDDQVGQVAQLRLGGMASKYNVFKDHLLGTMILNGDSSSLSRSAYDTGTPFFADTRTIGASANIDNIVTQSVSDVTAITASEIGKGIIAAEARMWSFEDDDGQPGHNAAAMQSLVVVAGPSLKSRVMEWLNATNLTGDSGSGSKTNVFQGMAQLQVIANITDTDKIWLCAVGENSLRPFIYQSRTPLVTQISDPADVEKDLGLTIMTRERFAFGYGDPRKAVQIDFDNAS